jgi:hypothetical protein
MIGVWALVFNFILAFSGFYMMLYAFDLKAQFGATSEKPLYPPAFNVNLDKLIQHTQQQIGGQFNYLDFPRKPDAPLRIFTAGKSSWLFGDLTNYMEFDRSSGKALKTFRPADLSPKEKFEYALYTLHYGQYGGLSIKILYCFFAIASSILSVSGFLLYYRRVK